MNLRIACIRVPGSPTVPPADVEVARLAGGLLSAAPRVTAVAGHPLAFWADASGMERRGGDAAVAQSLLRAAREAGFPAARVGVAGSCVAAAIATREEGSIWRVVPPGLDARYLRRRPLDGLPMEDELREALGLLGLKLCGELADLPAADVELRWGAEGMRAWRLAGADDPRWPFRPPVPDRVEAEAEWEPPIEGLEPLRFVLRGLIASITEQTAERQRVPAGLRLTLRLEADPARECEVRPARPTADARVLAELCERAIERLAAEQGLQAPISGIRIEATESGPTLADQLDLFRAAAPDPAAVETALSPLLSRWGEGALCRAVLRGAHLSIAYAVWEPRGNQAVRELMERHRARFEKPEPDPDTDSPASSTLTLCLRRFPEPVAARVTVDETGRPLRFSAPGESVAPGPARLSARVAPERRAPGAGTPNARTLPPLPVSPAALGPILRAEGPERLSGAWWEDGYAREYWLVESDEILWLLFRDANQDGWWVEGWWD
jgi:protein ImuB